MPRPINVVISGVDKLSGTLSKSTAGLNKFGKNARRVGKNLTLALTLPIVALGAASVNASHQFHEGMASVSTLIPTNKKRIEELGASVKQLAVTTGKTTEDITGGLYQTISAFGDTEETVGRLNIALKAGVAGMADTKSTLSMLSGVTKAYGDTSEEALQKVSDLAFKTVELGETTFPELAAEMGKVNSIAVNLGVTQEELFASFAAGTGPLGNTASVATKLSGAMVALMKPTTDMEIAFKKLGVANGRELIKQKGLRGAMQATSDIAKKYGVELAELYGRKEGLQFALSMAGAQADEFEVKLKKLGSATGATEDAFKKMTAENPGFVFKQFQQRVKVLAITFGDQLVPVLNMVLNKLTPFVKKLLALDDKTKKVILTVAGIAAAIGPVVFIIGSLSTALGYTILAIKGVAAALMFLVTNPVGIAITAIGLLAFGIYMLIKHWDKVVNFFKKTWEYISGLFQTKVGLIIAALLPMVGIPLLIASNWDKVTSAISKVLNVGSKIGSKFKSFFGGGTEEIINNKGGLVSKDDMKTSSVNGQELSTAAKAFGGASMQTQTNIKIENKANVRVRAEVDKGEVNLETQSGELIPAVG